MLLFERRFGRKDYDESELTDILSLGVCLAFEDNGIDKENAQKRTEIFLGKLQYYSELVLGADTDEDAIVIIETEVYSHLVEGFIDDVLEMDSDKLVEIFKDEEYMTKHHEVFYFAKQAYDLDDDNFRTSLKGFKFVG
ncbi:MAG: hypothetical protein CMI55_02580 [Parcubacteria group bacterium]|nr:hypothetical protein [Parcubacteria group bacterium]